MSIEEILPFLEELAEDRKIPRNVRSMIADAVKIIKEESEESLKARVTTAISILDEASTDPNLQQFSRTEIWNVVSMLESFLQSLDEDEEE